MKTVAAAIFILLEAYCHFFHKIVRIPLCICTLLCAAGFATMDGGQRLDELQMAAREMLDSFSERHPVSETE